MATLGGLFACTIPTTESVSPDFLIPEQGVVKGRVVDKHGHPVSNAAIVASNTDYYNKTSTGYTNADGYYCFTVPTSMAEGPCSVDGTLTIPYHGKPFKVALHRSDRHIA